MANVLTNLANDLYKAADIVGRELTGGLTSSIVNGDGSERAAVGQNVSSAFTNQATVNNVSPSMTIPEGDDQTVDKKTMQITKSRGVQIPWTGEDVRFINSGPGYETVYGDQVAQAIRKLANEMEVDLLTEAYQNASRAVGTAGTAPFGSDYDLIADGRRILVDNGTPTDNQISLVLNTLAGANLRKLAQLQKANEAGSTDPLRRGVLLDLQGVMLKESAGVQSHTAGTGSSYQTNSASLTAGDTVIAADTGTGTILAGDIVTFAADSDNEYVVTSALSGGSFTIAEPGLQVDIPDDNAITVESAYTGNVMFHRNALEIAMRAPAVPEGGDQADDDMIVQDPFSGMSFEVRFYKGYRKSMIEVAAAWGVKMWKPEFSAIVKG